MLRRLLILLLVGLLAACTVRLRAAADEQQKDYPYSPVAFTDVKVEDSFWSPRLETNRKVTVAYDFAKCEETGRIANFARAGGLEQGPFQGIPFNDSDVVKVVEGAAYTLALQPDPKLEQYLDELIAKIAAAQEGDGYLYSARTLGFTNRMTGPKRWSNLRASHELYNVGHMYEAAVAHYLATGKRAFLEVAIRNADLLCQLFGKGQGQIVDVPGHQEIEIGLVKLYRVTGETRYLDLARFFIDMRGRTDKRQHIYGEYCQDHKPVVEQAEAVGHAVRAGYLYSGMADVAAITGDEQYVQAIDRIWEDMVSTKMYLTGSVGKFGHGEGYAAPYDLPNNRAYNETCAAIANALWNHRMFLLHGDAKYIDVMERIIYNGFLAGISLSGDRFFYPNPLACDLNFKFNQGALERKEWFGCSCCPVNVVRFIPSLAGYIYAHRKNSVYVNLFMSGTGSMQLGERAVKLTQQSQYPWHGRVALTVEPDTDGEFALHMRIPGWAVGRPVPSDLYRYLDSETPPYTVRVNGDAVTPVLEKGYVVLRRRWQAGDTVDLELPMPVRRVVANDKVEADRGRVAVERGPMVYCVEGADHEGQVRNVYLPDDASFTAEPRPEMLGGVTVLRGTGQAVYRAEDGAVRGRPIQLTAIPYYAWCHRGANEMAVWLPRSMELADVPPAPTIASHSRASASHCWHADTVAALHDQALPQNSNDHSIPRLTWWDHRGSAEWVQYDFKDASKVSAVEIYWFDDTGRGHCRVPAAWQVLYRDKDAWKAVSTTQAYGVAKDRFNRVNFDPVTTDGLRIAVQLQPEWSGGILEWRVVSAKEP